MGNKVGRAITKPFRLIGKAFKNTFAGGGIRSIATQTKPVVDQLDKIRNLPIIKDALDKTGVGSVYDKAKGAYDQVAEGANKIADASEAAKSGDLSKLKDLSNEALNKVSEKFGQNAGVKIGNNRVSLGDVRQLVNNAPNQTNKLGDYAKSQAEQTGKKLVDQAVDRLMVGRRPLALP